MNVYADTHLSCIHMSVRCHNCLTKYWETGQRDPYPAQLITVADLKRVPLQYFYQHVRNCGENTVLEIAGILLKEQMLQWRAERYGPNRVWLPLTRIPGPAA